MDGWALKLYIGVSKTGLRGDLVIFRNCWREYRLEMVLNQINHSKEIGIAVQFSKCNVQVWTE